MKKVMSKLYSVAVGLIVGGYNLLFSMVNIPLF